MKWKTTKPTKPGWYWAKDKSTLLMVRIEAGANQLDAIWIMGIGSPQPDLMILHLSELGDGLWAGPIRIPK